MGMSMAGHKVLIYCLLTVVSSIELTYCVEDDSLNINENLNYFFFN